MKRTVNQPPVRVTGVWLRRIGDEAQVLVERDGCWYLCITEHYETLFSHIIEPSGILLARPDPVTNVATIDPE